MARQEKNLITENYYSRKMDRSTTEKNRKFLMENFTSILENSDTILKNKEMFFSLPLCTYVGTTLTGLLMLPIGLMLQLWEENVFINECGICGYRAYIFNAQGSLLSGTATWTEYCFQCNEERSKKQCNGKILALPLEKMNEYPNKRVYERYALQSSNWFDKLKEKRRDNRVVKDWIEGIPFEDLIARISH